MKTNREKFYERHNIPLTESLSLEKISSLSKMPEAALQKVFQKGLGAAKTNSLSVRLKGTFEKNVPAPRSQKLSSQQWAYARVYAFVMRTRPVFYTADRHIAEEYGLLRKKS